MKQKLGSSIPCNICGKFFIKKYTRQSNCSDVCKKEALRIIVKRTYQKNKIKRLANQKKYYYKNWDKYQIVLKKYRDNHKPQQKKLYKSWVKKNRKHIREYARNYKNLNLEIVKAQNRKKRKIYADRNQDKIKARRKTEKIKIPLKQLCQMCNTNKAIQKHHLDYARPMEILFLCKICHGRLHNKDYSDYKQVSVLPTL